MLLAYWLSVYNPIFSHISISCIVAEITNSKFHMHKFNLLSCVGHFPFSLLQYTPYISVHDDMTCLVVTGHVALREDGGTTPACIHN